MPALWIAHHGKSQRAQGEDPSENPERYSIASLLVKPPAHEYRGQQDAGKVGELDKAPQLAEGLSAKVFPQGRPVSGGAGFSNGKEKHENQDYPQRLPGAGQ